jgi:hypothetical protein
MENIKSKDDDNGEKVGMDHMHKTNYIDKIVHMNDTDHINHINNKISHSDEINLMNEIDHDMH